MYNRHSGLKYPVVKKNSRKLKGAKNFRLTLHITLQVQEVTQNSSIQPQHTNKLGCTNKKGNYNKNLVE